MTPLARVAEAFPGVPVLRVMPNQPVAVRDGVLCHPPPVAMSGALSARLFALSTSWAPASSSTTSCSMRRWR